jgi:hypothetical protein
MGKIDKRNRLDEEVFSYHVTKNQTVIITWLGKQVKVLKGKEAEKFLAKEAQAVTKKDIQLLLAKATGNFKRGKNKSAGALVSSDRQKRS